MVEHFFFTISLSVIPFCLTKSWMDFVNSWDTCSFRTNVKHCTLLEYKWIWQLEGFAVKDTNFHTQSDTTIFVISHHIIIYTTFAAWYFSPWLHWFLWLEYSNNMSIQKMQSFWHIIGMPHSWKSIQKRHHQVLWVMRLHIRTLLVIDFPLYLPQKLFCNKIVEY